MLVSSESSNSSSNNNHTSSLCVMTWNIMRDFPHFHSSNPAFAWHNREPRIIALIKDVNADIIGLQECIDLPGEPILKFLHKLKSLGYDFEIFTDMYGNNDKQLKVVTLWKRDSIYKHSSYTRWLSPQCQDSKPAVEWHQKVARPVGVSCFMHMHSNKPMWIWNTHLGHSEFEKEMSCNLLIDLIAERTASDHAVVLLGDFNLFKKSERLRYILTHNAKCPLQDLGREATTILDSRTMPNTFVSSSIDSIQLPPGSIGDRLDYQFGYRVSLDGPARIWNKTMLDVEPPYLQQPDVFPSDHLPLVTRLFC